MSDFERIGGDMRVRHKTIFSEERERIVLSILEEHGRITIEELCMQCNVSESTARKQLASMAKRQLLIRTHGGAIAIDQDVEAKIRSQVKPKRSIANTAREHIQNGEAIILGSGSTVLELARLMHGLQDVIVITDSILVANELMRNRDVEVQICSGIVHGKSGCIIGDQAAAFFQNISTTKCFIGVDGISTKVGITIDNIRVAQVEQKLPQCALTTFAMADSSKLNRVSFTRICGIEDIDHIITDSNADPAQVEALRKRGVAVTVVDITS